MYSYIPNNSLLLSLIMFTVYLNKVYNIAFDLLPKWRINCGIAMYTIL